MRRLPWIALSLALVAACAGEVEPGPDKDGSPPPTDQQVAPDRTGVADGPAGCTEGDKRCGGLYTIQQCTNGAWVDTVSCKDKKIGGQECTCSITLFYVCAYGANECP